MSLNFQSLDERAWISKKRHQVQPETKEHLDIQRHVTYFENWSIMLGFQPETKSGSTRINSTSRSAAKSLKTLKFGRRCLVFNQKKLGSTRNKSTFRSATKCHKTLNLGRKCLAFSQKQNNIYNCNKISLNFKPWSNVLCFQPETKSGSIRNNNISRSAAKGYWSSKHGQTCLAFSQKQNGVQPEEKPHLDLQQTVTEI